MSVPPACVCSEWSHQFKWFNHTHFVCIFQQTLIIFLFSVYLFSFADPFSFHVRLLCVDDPTTLVLLRLYYSSRNVPHAQTLDSIKCVWTNIIFRLQPPVLYSEPTLLSSKEMFTLCYRKSHLAVHPNAKLQILLHYISLLTQFWPTNQHIDKVTDRSMTLIPSTHYSQKTNNRLNIERDTMDFGLLQDGDDITTLEKSLKTMLLCQSMGICIKVRGTSNTFGFRRIDNSLKSLDTFGNCQRPVFSLGVSQHIHTITNLWKFELSRSSKLRDNNERKN